MKKTNTQSGFTLIELLMVILIITMLAVFVVPRMLKKVGGAKRDIATIQNTPYLAVLTGMLLPKKYGASLNFQLCCP